MVVIGLSSKINIAKFRHITIIPKVHSIASLSETMQIFAKEKKIADSKYCFETGSRQMNDCLY